MNEAAQYYLGIAYDEGRGVARNPAKALYWFREASRKNLAARYRVGNHYLNGEGVARDPIEATKQYLSAAAEGHGDAQYKLGQMFHTGLGVKKDNAMAYMLALLASKNGVSDAMQAGKEWANELSPERRKKVEELAETWKPGTLLPWGLNIGQN